jgi:hypothetical protein
LPVRAYISIEKEFVKTMPNVKFKMRLPCLICVLQTKVEIKNLGAGFVISTAEARVYKREES